MSDECEGAPGTCLPYGERGNLPGWRQLEVWTDGQTMVLLGDPPGEDTDPAGELHSCDANGCGSGHVLLRMELPAEAKPHAAAVLARPLRHDRVYGDPLSLGFPSVPWICARCLAVGQDVPAQEDLYRNYDPTRYHALRERKRRRTPPDEGA